MTSAITSSTTSILGEPVEKSKAPDARAFRTRKSFAVVHFEPGGKGRIVFLPEGAEVRVIGASCLCECFEVIHDDQLYNIFKADLLGPWSTPIEAKPIKPGRMRPIRALAVGACA